MMMTLRGWLGIKTSVSIYLSGDKCSCDTLRLVGSWSRVWSMFHCFTRFPLQIFMCRDFMPFLYTKWIEGVFILFCILYDMNVASQLYHYQQKFGLCKRKWVVFWRVFTRACVSVGLCVCVCVCVVCVVCVCGYCVCACVLSLGVCVGCVCPSLSVSVCMQAWDSSLQWGTADWN